MHSLSLDIETYSSHDLRKTGVYKYVEAPDFEILMLAYSFDGGPVEIVDRGEMLVEFPRILYAALTDPNVKKQAWNCNFELTCIRQYFGMDLKTEQWYDSMITASACGLPMSLDQAGKVLKIEGQKFTGGKALIRYFSMPCKPTAKNGQRTRNLPEHDPDKWEAFKEYCKQDVVAEQEIAKKLSFYTVPDTERRLWILDQKINDAGIKLDRELVNQAIKIDTTHSAKLTGRAIELTGLTNPNSGAQLKEWLSDAMWESVTTLKKEDIPVLLEKTDDAVVRQVLNIRQEMAKTSIKKYEAMRRCICTDDRARGLLQFNGASATGRWAGRLLQPQNLSRCYLKDLDLARQVLKEGDGELMEMAFGNVPDTLSQLIRTAFIAEQGHRFIVIDYSSIELVIAAWLAGEQWVLDEFNGRRKIYEQTAARMLNVPVEDIGEDSIERQKGKISSLACQYGGGVGALVKMGALRMGLLEDELPEVITLWRKANSRIVKYWKIVEKAAIKAVKEGISVSLGNNIKFYVSKGILFTQLPSGRALSFIRPCIKEGKYGDALTYEGMNQTTKQWGVQDTYGGKIFEQICQGTARDCLAVGMTRLDSASYKTVLTVHDELVLEMPNGVGSLEEVNRIITEPISWAPGLPLAAKGFENHYYKK